MNISVITASRADFGLLKNLIIKLKKNKSFQTSVIASGSHFYSKFGNTQKEIKDSGIKINKRIICNFDTYNANGISKIISKCILKSTQIFKELNPKLIIVLGDRYEILGSVISAHILNIPIAHIHGGEVTNGVIDDAFRHSITKMSSLHFVVHDIYKKRVVQLGENPKYIFNVGSLAADSIYNTKLIKKNVLEKKFNLKFSKNNFLVTFHPETLARKKSKIQIKILLSALRTFKNTMFIFTYPGADLENKEIINEIKIFTKRHNNAYFFRSLGQKNYLSFMNCVDGIIGNSSSGILEMPYFKKGTVNIGKRQTGRLCANSVINTKIHKRSIEKSIKKIISKNFLKKIKQSKNNLFGSSGVSDKIIKILKKINYKHINKKSFFDIKIYKKNRKINFMF